MNRYDTLSAEEQAVVRAEWSARMDSQRVALNFAEQFAAAGRTWVESDDDGNIVERGKGAEASSSSRPSKPGTSSHGTS